MDAASYNEPKLIRNAAITASVRHRRQEPTEQSAFENESSDMGPSPTAGEKRKRWELPDEESSSDGDSLFVSQHKTLPSLSPIADRNPLSGTPTPDTPSLLASSSTQCGTKFMQTPHATHQVSVATPVQHHQSNPTKPYPFIEEPYTDDEDAIEDPAINAGGAPPDSPESLSFKGSSESPAATAPSISTPGMVKTVERSRIDCVEVTGEGSINFSVTAQSITHDGMRRKTETYKAEYSSVSEQAATEKQEGFEYAEDVISQDWVTSLATKKTSMPVGKKGTTAVSERAPMLDTRDKELRTKNEELIDEVRENAIRREPSLVTEKSYDEGEAEAERKLKKIRKHLEDAEVLINGTSA